ncbi:MAG TPA: hypothetical protein VF173_13865 [Thermoanaerobaculia bacterium]|nr:hypothetical protein [Thermoanaerobaculia bacterium]
MKKLKMKKLSLNRETLGVLETSKLSEAQGGASIAGNATCITCVSCDSCRTSVCVRCDPPPDFTQECTVG